MAMVMEAGDDGTRIAAENVRSDDMFKRLSRLLRDVRIDCSKKNVSLRFLDNTAYLAVKWSETITSKILSFFQIGLVTGNLNHFMRLELFLDGELKEAGMRQPKLEEGINGVE